MNKVTRHPKVTEEELKEVERELEKLNRTLESGLKKAKHGREIAKLVQYAVLVAIITGCLTFTGWAIVAFVRFVGG